MRGVGAQATMTIHALKVLPTSAAGRHLAAALSSRNGALKFQPRFACPRGKLGVGWMPAVCRRANTARNSFAHAVFSVILAVMRDAMSLSGAPADQRTKVFGLPQLVALTKVNECTEVARQN